MKYDFDRLDLRRMEICRVAVVIKKNIFKVEKIFFLRCMLYVVLCASSGGKLDNRSFISDRFGL